MKIDVNCYSKQTIDVDEREALRILCKTLEMEWILSDDGPFTVIPDDDGYLDVYKLNAKSFDMHKPIGEQCTLYDDRGELFVALSNLIVRMFPNVDFRSAGYIWDFTERCFNGERIIKD